MFFYWEYLINVLKGNKFLSIIIKGNIILVFHCADQKTNIAYYFII